MVCVVYIVYKYLIDVIKHVDNFRHVVSLLLELAATNFLIFIYEKLNNDRWLLTILEITHLGKRRYYIIILVFCEVISNHVHCTCILDGFFSFSFNYTISPVFIIINIPKYILFWIWMTSDFLIDQINTLESREIKIDFLIPSVC